MSRHNLNTVIGFEFFRVVKKRRFWVATLAIPVGLAVVFALVIISNLAPVPPPKPRRTHASPSPTPTGPGSSPTPWRPPTEGRGPATAPGPSLV